MKKLIVFNWKSNPATASTAIKLAKAVENAVPKKNLSNIVIAPPFLFLEDVGGIIKKTKLGSQDTFWQDVGPYTGEISWHQEKNIKVKYVIIGHSERRQILKETDEMINKKVLAALKAGLKIILCVGEPLKIRKKSKRAIENFIKSQLQKDLKNIENLKLPARPEKIKNSLIIAYEPIWAIGTNQADTPQDAVEMIKFIKKILLRTTNYGLQTKILYGGSVDGKNIKNFVKYKEINGFLVGHASLKINEIKNIIKICAQKN